MRVVSELVDGCIHVLEVEDEELFFCLLSEIEQTYSFWRLMHGVD